MVSQFGDAFADVATCVSAIERSALPVDTAPEIAAGPAPAVSVLTGVDPHAFAPSQPAPVASPAPVTVPALAVREYFAPQGLAPVPPSEPASEGDGPELADSESSECADEGQEGIVLEWGVGADDSDDDEFGDAVGEFGGVFGDARVTATVSGAAPALSESPDVQIDVPLAAVPRLALPPPSGVASPLTPSPPRSSPRIPLTDSDADMQALSFDDSGEADVGATEGRGVWYDGSGPGTVRVYAGRGRRLLSIQANPNHFDAPAAEDPRMHALAPQPNEFGDDSTTRKGRLTLSFHLTTLDVSFKLFGGSDWVESAPSVAVGLFGVREPAPPPAAHRRVSECVEVLLTGVSCAMQGYAHDDDATGEWKWSLDSVLLFAVRDIEVVDRIASSPLHLVLGYGAVCVRVSAVIPSTIACLLCVRAGIGETVVAGTVRRCCGCVWTRSFPQRRAHSHSCCPNPGPCCRKCGCTSRYSHCD